jgi:hypothetical protein
MGWQVREAIQDNGIRNGVDAWFEPPTWRWTDPHVTAFSIARRITTRREDIPPSGLLVLT